MFRLGGLLRFRIEKGDFLVDFKILSRDHKKSLVVEDAVVDPEWEHTVFPLSWLERLRSPSPRLPTGYYMEQHGAFISSAIQKRLGSWRGDIVSAGPLVLYITGIHIPVVLSPLFVPDDAPIFCSTVSRRSSDALELDLRLGLDAIEQCSLLAEMRPGGLLYSKLPIHEQSPVKALEPVQSILRRYGLSCGLSESPLNRRPWTRMKHMFIDELQRGPKLTEFVGHNPRSGVPWRFSQHNRHFRQGIWSEIVRRNEMNPGLHAHSSWQKSHQQSVPEVSFIAPSP